MEFSRKHRAGRHRWYLRKLFSWLIIKGKMTGSWTSCTGGSPCLNLFDAQGKVRLQLGLYSAAGEAGLPFVILNNERQEPKAILRLFGNNAAPVLVLKNNNQDKNDHGLRFSEFRRTIFSSL
jgi:hypothetical protein